MSRASKHYPDFEILVGSGKIHGVSSFSKFGRNGDIDTGTIPEEIWNGGGLRYYPTSAETTHLVSSSTDDDVAGTGALTVRVIGLDADYNYLEEDVIVTGTTPVVLTNKFLRADRAHVLTAGSTGAAQGDIDVYHANNTTEKMIDMPAGRNQTAITGFTVPKDHVLLINRISVGIIRSAGTVTSEFIIESREADGVWRTKQFFGPAGSGSSFLISGSPTSFIKFDEMTDIRITCIYSSANNVVGIGSYDGYLIDKREFSF